MHLLILSLYGEDCKLVPYNQGVVIYVIFGFFHIRCIVLLIRCTTICSFNCEEHDNLYGFFIKAMIK